MTNQNKVHLSDSKSLRSGLISELENTGVDTHIVHKLHAILGQPILLSFPKPHISRNSYCKWQV